MSSRRWVLENANARIEVDLDAGGRIASWTVGDLELLVGRESDAMRWGLFPMAPWAGRVREGRFRFNECEHALPLDLPPHAIHGTVWKRPWEVEGDTLVCKLGEDWPFEGRACQSLRLEEDRLELTLEVLAEHEPFPASCGWHPWFKRRLDRGDPVEIDLDAAFMERRDEAGIPSGDRVPQPPGPWDDCFGGLRRPPTLRWPGALELSISSDAAHIVVYDQPAHAVCVEPQSAPPDALNQNPFVVRPGTPLVVKAVFRWSDPGG